MSALAELRKRAGLPAISAIAAIPSQPLGIESQESQESQRDSSQHPLSTLRQHLLTLVERHGGDPALIHRLHDQDIAGCLGLDEAQLRTYLAMLEATAMRWAGRVPLDHTAAILCQGCGPVWVPPTVAAVLPVVRGWPRALGCPWCLVRKTGSDVPRPSIRCEGCQHALADAIHPGAGVGGCGLGHGTHYPMASHACAAFQPGDAV